MGVRRDLIVGRELKVGDEDAWLVRIAEDQGALRALRQYRLVLPWKRVGREHLHGVGGHAIDFRSVLRVCSACDGKQERRCQKHSSHVFILILYFRGVESTDVESPPNPAPALPPM